MNPENCITDEDAEDRFLRANTWGMLAHMLAAAPNAALLQRLAALPRAAEHDTTLGWAWADLAQAARETDADRLKAEYQALFIGVTRGEVMPYASWYHTGFLIDKPLVDIRADLTALGYGRKPGIREPEDHAAALCEVMAHLVADGDLRQAAFFQRHLTSWLPRLLNDVDRAPSAVFYRAFSEFALTFVELEDEYLDKTS